MGNKAECPGCKSWTPGVWDALHGSREACPSCGLSGAVMAAVYDARKKHADAELAVKYEEAMVRAGRAEAETRALRERLESVRHAMSGCEEQEKALSKEARYSEWSHL